MSLLWQADYRPLRIRAVMAGPICVLPHEGLPLDGILEFAAFHLGCQPVDPERHGHGRMPGPNSAAPPNFVIPVKRIGHKDDPNWYWSASWATFPEDFEVDRAHWNKRFDGGRPELSPHLNFGGKSEKFNVKSGRYKSYHMPMSLILAPVIDWYCLGAYDGIAECLKVITHLGKKRSQGFGEVVRWELWPSEENWSCWRDGKPMRALPDRSGDFKRAHVGIRPPHWHPDRRRLCIVPFPENSGSGPSAECPEETTIERARLGP